MSLSDAIYDRLAGHSGVAALVGTRIYRLKMPQTPTWPLLVFFRVSKVRPHAMGVDAGVSTVRVQVSCWDLTHDGADALAEQVRLALGRWRGVQTGVTIQESLEEGMSDAFDDAATTMGAYHLPIDFMISYAES